MFELGWLSRARNSRAVHVSDVGREGLKLSFGVELEPEPPRPRRGRGYLRSFGSVGGSSSEYKRTGRSGSIRFPEGTRAERLALGAPPRRVVKELEHVVAPACLSD